MGCGRFGLIGTDCVEGLHEICERRLGTQLVTAAVCPVTSYSSKKIEGFDEVLRPSSYQCLDLQKVQVQGQFTPKKSTRGNSKKIKESPRHQ